MTSAAERVEQQKKEPVVIKKYANRRLYNTETSTYVTLDDLAGMVRAERDFVVYDAKSGEDLTHSVLTQIIVEQESRPNGQNLLPIGFLRQLIRFYGDSMERLVPSYLELSLSTLTREQERYRQQFASVFGQNPFGTAAFDAMQEHTRKNLAMWEKAMAMFTPFGAAMAMGGQGKPGELGATAKDSKEGKDAKAAHQSPTAPTLAPVSTPAGKATELAEMQAQLLAMQAKIEKLAKGQG